MNNGQSIRDNKPFSCVIVGEGTLPLQCAEILLGRGHAIRAVVSPDQRLARWAAEHGIPQGAAPDQLGDLLGGQPFDYLFSVVNYQLLPAELLAAPRRWAINYHDAPLPRYAGSYATSWALLAGERLHAISWHLMTGQVDAGDILRQHPIEIAPDETALTLNAKCYDAALRSFAALVDDLAAGLARPRPQDLAGRSFFARQRRPPAGCALTWQQGAGALAALVRAMQFGPYPNPLGLPKLALAGDFVAVTALEPLATPSALPPGTIVSVAEDALIVATADRDVALRELLTLEGQPLPIQALAARYDLRAGQRLPDPPARLTELYGRLCRHEAFWVERLAQLQPARLPYAARTAEPAPRWQLYEIDLPPASWDGPPGERARLLLAAFAIYLARLGGQTVFDMGFGDGALRGEIGDLGGFFATLVPLHVELNMRWTFAQLARALGAQLEQISQRGSYARDIVARYPALRELPELHTPRPWSVAVEIASQPLSPALDTGAGDAGLARELTLQVAADGAAGRWIYDANTLQPAQIERMARQFEALLRGIAASPGLPIADLPLLPEAERRQLAAWNETAAPLRDACAHELFAEQARRTPAAIAVAFGEQRLTYQELDRRANQLAWHLQAQGAGAETLVGLYMERSLDLVVGLLAILKSGSAYVPIDPAYPAERIAAMLEDSRAAVLLTEARLAERLVGADARVVCLGDNLRAALEHAPATAPASAVGSRNLAYVLFTSGSTGRPKGVAIEHRSVVALLDWAAQVFTAEELAGVLFSTSICFDLSVFELLAPLSRGGTAILVENALHLPSLAPDRPVTLVNTVPSVIAELVRTGGLPPTVRTVNLAGEPLPAALVEQIYQQTTVRRVFDLYGPSEDTTYSTYALRRPGGPATIGRPLANTCVYLLDANQQPVPIGVPGELYISGAGLARGYLNRPDLTAERFVPNPFGQGSGIRDQGSGSQASAPDPRPLIPNPRMYRTGDLARYLPDGAIEFLGRIDHQVKIRGFRIELGEIEAALRRHPAVSEAVVLARADAPSGKRLVAYVVPAGDRRPTTDDRPAEDSGWGIEGSNSLSMGESQFSALGSRTLAEFLRQLLPEYMIPSAFVFLDALPLTPNRKIDRRALPAPDHAAMPDEGYVAPRDHVEELLAGIWSQVLGVPRVGIHDNFFALGGDSIISIQIIARAGQLGLRLTPRQIFQHQTIAELAPAAGSAPVAQADQGPVAGAPPLTPIQQWFFEHELPERHHWNQAMLLELPAPIDPALLERALGRLADHHDALRLRFERGAGGWQQRHAAPGAPVPLLRVDLAALAEPERPAAIAAAMAEVQSGLDIANGPLLRAALFAHGAGQPDRLLIAIHHLAVDGVSWRILLGDLQALVSAALGGRPDTGRLPPKTTSFKQWAEGLERYARSGRLQPEADAWLTAPRTRVARLPLDFPAYRGANSEASARAISVALSAEETHALLHELPAAYAVQINDILMTALACALARWIDAGPLLVDLEGHGREDLWDGLDLSRTVGWFTAIFPVLLEPERGAHPVAALRSIKEQLAYVPRRGVGYGLLRYLSGDQELAAKLRALPQAEISFNYLGQFDQTFAEGAGFRLLQGPVGPLHGLRGQRFHLLEISGSVAGGRLRMDWVYSENLHRQATIAALAEDFLAALRLLIAERHSPHAGGYSAADFPLAGLSQAALGRLTGQARDVADIYPLAPGQQAMLAQTLRGVEPGVYTLQWRCTLHGPLDEAALERSAQRVAQRHAVLRTEFAWQALDQPLQLVRQALALPWRSYDLRGLAADEQARRLAALLAEDQAQGFDLARAPLARLLLARLGDDRYSFCWSFHHLLIDGWSASPLLHELFTLYEAMRQPRAAEAEPAYTGYERRRRKTGPLGQRAQLPAARPYRSYIAWLQQQDQAGAAAFWRAYLGGAAPLRLELGRPAGAAGYGEQQRRIDVAATAALRAMAQQAQVTLNTLVQGAKALLLSRYSQREDVIFGVTLAGRPAALADVETIVGPFINTLPLRVAVPPNARLLPWLRRLQQRQAELAQHEATPLAQALAWAGLGAETPLFETILRFQNYPLDPSLWRRDGLEISDPSWFDRWHYPISLVAEPGAALTLGATYDRRRFDDTAIARMLEQLHVLLESFTDRLDCQLGDLLETV